MGEVVPFRPRRTMSDEQAEILREAVEAVVPDGVLATIHQIEGNPLNGVVNLLDMIEDNDPDHEPDQGFYY